MVYGGILLACGRIRTLIRGFWGRGPVQVDPGMGAAVYAGINIVGATHHQHLARADTAGNGEAARRAVRNFVNCTKFHTGSLFGAWTVRAPVQ